MSLPTCPSCGQSVLEDDVVDCPFCGAAMDGSRGAKNVPKPQARPNANRFGARKNTAPAEPEPAPKAPAAATPAATAKPAVPAANAARGGKPKVDEDDPFGMGAAGKVDAIQASAKPEKGKLHKVTCPMCEAVGFVAKTAIGKPVRCANEKCLVPVFTAPESSEPGAERKPVRVSDTAEASRRLAESSGPKKRSPVMMYAVLGIVGAAVAAGVIFMLQREQSDPNLNRPIQGSEGPVVDEEEEDRKQREAAIAAKAAADAANPALEIAALTKRMITLARSQGVRDKALARRLTADVLLRAGEAEQAATELNHLASLENGSRKFYRIEPHIAAYWRLIKDKPDGAKKELELATSDLAGVGRSGRASAEAVMDLAAVFVREGRQPEALQMLNTRRLDRSTPANRDLMASIAWLYINNRCRDVGTPGPAVVDMLRWTDPFSAAVAVNLAIHDEWTPAIHWSVAVGDQHAAADALIAVADIARTRKAPADTYATIEAMLGTGADPIQALRVRAAIAAAADAAKLNAVLATLQQLPTPGVIALPNSTELVQQDVADRSSALLRAEAAAEVARAAVILKQPDTAKAALERMGAELASAAPPTSSTRAQQAAMAADERGYSRRIASEMGVSDQNQFEGMFRNYRRHLEQFTTAAEDRRYCHLALLARIVRAGGAPEVEQSITATPEARQELMLDELCGLVSAAARSTGNLPAALTPDRSLFKGRAAMGDAQAAVPVAEAMEMAWASNTTDLAAALEYLSQTGAGSTLPGLRQALTIELVEVRAATVAVPPELLTPVLSIQQEVWREESFAIVAGAFVDRKQEKATETWLAQQKLKPLEQIAILYGQARGMLKRPMPAAPQTVNEKSKSGSGESGG